jgi:hypothetical protein
LILEDEHDGGGAVDRQTDNGGGESRLAREAMFAFRQNAAAPEKSVREGCRWSASISQYSFR